MAQGRIWPEPGQMHNYLDRWHAYLQEAEAALAQEVKARAEDNAVHKNLIDDLLAKLDTQAEPLEQKIAVLNQELAHAKAQIAALEQTARENLERLALVLEISSSARSVTLTSVVSHAVLVIEESKQMIRENL